MLALVLLSRPAGADEATTPLPAAVDGSKRDEQVDRLQTDLLRLRHDLDEERSTRRAQEAATAAERTQAKDHPALRLLGFAQADAVLYRQDSQDELDGTTGRPLNETRFLVRRAHLRAETTWRFLSGALEVMATTTRDPLVRFFAAEVSAAWPARGDQPPIIAARIGLLRVPFGRENQENAPSRLFLERSAVVRALFPGDNDLGVVVQGALWVLRWQLAAMNGHPLGERAFPALDPTAQKDFLGRLGATFALPRGLGVSTGVSALWGTGFHAGTPSTKDSVGWRDINGDGVVQTSELTPVFGAAATPSDTFRRYSVGGDLRLTAQVPRLGELVLTGEIVWAANLDRGLVVADPIAVGRDLREIGFSVAATQALTRFAQLGLRYDRYDPDADASDQIGPARVPRDASLSAVAVAAAARLPPYGRVVLEYDHQQNALGRTPAGLPTTLASDAVTLRAEVVF